KAACGASGAVRAAGSAPHSDAAARARRGRIPRAHSRRRVRTLSRQQEGDAMSRRNQGPRLRWLGKRGSYYITWTERGRSRERSTGTTDREQAQVALAEFLRQRDRRGGPRDPSQILVAAILSDSARARGPNVTAPDVMGRSIAPLVEFWAGKTVADVTPQGCEDYQRKRARAKGTMRRELGVLRTAINWCHKNGRLARAI